MNEARRFLRYVIPGIVFVINAAIVLWVLRPDLFFSYLHAVRQDAGIGLVLAGVLATGGLGVLFSVLHHNWHWVSVWPLLDHTGFVKRLIDERTVQLVSDKPAKLSRHDAWMLVTKLWQERTTSNPEIESAEAGTEELIDLVHSMGAMRVAALLGLVVAVFLGVENDHREFILKPGFRFWGAIAIGIATTGVLHFNYVRLAKFAKGVIECILCDALITEAAKNGRVKIHLPPKFARTPFDTKSPWRIAGWFVGAVAMLVGLYFAWQSYHRKFPTIAVTVMLKSSPDGRHTAKLIRVQGSNVTFNVHVDGSNVYNSDGFATRHVEFRENITWDTNSRVLLFEVAGTRLFGYDVRDRRALTNSELSTIQFTPLDRLQFQGTNK